MGSEFRKIIIKSMTEANLPHLFFDCLNEKHSQGYIATIRSGKEIYFKNINNMTGDFICVSDGNYTRSESCFNVNDISLIEVDRRNIDLDKQPISYREQIEREERI